MLEVGKIMWPRKLWRKKGREREREGKRERASKSNHKEETLYDVKRGENTTEDSESIQSDFVSKVMQG